jgi:metal-responsive CopG/Arc/MetJ family transcriptional regulator
MAHGKSDTTDNPANQLERVGVSLPKHQIEWLDHMADRLDVPRSHIVHAVITDFRVNKNNMNEPATLQHRLERNIDR